MIYIKNNTETQTVFIPRNELQKEAYVTSIKTYEDGYREGLEDGKEYQKDQLLNLYVTENGQYEREDGWGTVTVDIPIGDCPECEDCSGVYDEGYNQGYEDGQNSVECPECEDCSGAYDEGYEIGKNEGYEDGFQDGYDQGQADCPECEDCPELTTIDITENGSYEGVFNLVNVNVPQNGEKCNLEDKMITPSMEDRDGNGYIVVEEGEEYNGLSRVVIDPSTIYNEGYNQGQNDCPSEGGCNLEDKRVIPTMNDRDDNGYIVIDQSEGYDGLDRVVIDPTTIYNEGVSAGKEDCEQRYNEGYNEGYTDGYYEGSNQLSNNVLEGDMVLSFQLNDNNFPDLYNDGKGIFSWDGYKVPLYIKRPNGCGELYLSGNYDNHITPSLQSKFFQDSDYAKIEKLTINFWNIQSDNIVNVVNLKELHLTENVEIISNNAFQDVNNLKTIYSYFDGFMYATKDSFVGLPNNGTLYVKKSARPSWGWIEDLGWTIVNI